MLKILVLIFLAFFVLIEKCNKKTLQNQLQNSVQYDIIKMYLAKKVMYIENGIKKPYLVDNKEKSLK